MVNYKPSLNIVETQSSQKTAAALVMPTTTDMLFKLILELAETYSRIIVSTCYKQKFRHSLEQLKTHTRLGYYRLSLSVLRTKSKQSRHSVSVQSKHNIDAVVFATNLFNEYQSYQISIILTSIDFAYNCLPA